MYGDYQTGYAVFQLLGPPINPLSANEIDTITQACVQTPQFIVHRVNEIQHLLLPAPWMYYPSDSNPADHLTRGLCTVSVIFIVDQWSNMVTYPTTVAKV